jgi:hypothetical protein
MNKLPALLGLLALSVSAHATCFGSGSFQTCTDDSGNTYNVQRYGNTTSVQGTNAQTGSTWSQQSHTYGNTTQTYGNSNGRSWNETTTTSPGVTNSSGTDSHGRPFNKTCTQYGCY